MTLTRAQMKLVHVTKMWLPRPVMLRYRRRHRVDDAFDAGDLAVVDLDVAGFLREPGHHAHQVAERAHLLDLLHLLEEVVERERALEQPSGGLFGLLGFEGGLGLLGHVDCSRPSWHPFCAHW